MKRLPLFTAEAANRMKLFCSTTFPYGIVPMVGRKTPNFGPQTKKAAVFIPITNFCDEPAILFTLRSNAVVRNTSTLSISDSIISCIVLSLSKCDITTYRWSSDKFPPTHSLTTLYHLTQGTHKGQVSFPGGHLEEHESPIDAALRETNEELGIEFESLESLTWCQAIPAITGTAVTPVIGHVHIDFDRDYNSKLRVNEKEVERVFFRTISELLADRTTETLSRDGITMDFPVFGANHENK